MNKIKYDLPIYQRQPVGNKGRYKYVPVGAYVEFDCFSIGAHLLVVDGNCTSYLHNVEIDRAGVLAALKLSKEAMVKAMSEASDFKPTQTEITQEQRELLDKLRETGFNESSWIRESLYDIVEAGFKVLEV